MHISQDLVSCRRVIRLNVDALQAHLGELAVFAGQTAHVSEPASVPLGLAQLAGLLPEL